MTDFAQRRTMMVDTQVRPNEVTSYPVIEAMLHVPREQFVPDTRRDVAYAGEDIALAPGRVLLEPRTLGKMMDVLDLQSDDLVLNVGCGLGYSAAVIARIAEFGGDEGRAGVAGDSAGGNLAAVTAIACRDAGIKLAAQLLVYPVTDVAGNFADAEENARFPSRSENAEGYFLTRATMEWFCGHYLADKSDGTDWRVSPLRAKNLAGVAPAIVTTAWFDPLRDEGKAYADALKAAGVPTSYYNGLGLIHGYFGLGEASETAKREAQRARADFKALLEKGA